MKHDNQISRDLHAAALVRMRRVTIVDGHAQDGTPVAALLAPRRTVCARCGIDMWVLACLAVDGQPLLCPACQPPDIS